MKKLLGFVVLGLLFSSNAKADHYKTGILFADPYVIGCIYDFLDASFGNLKLPNFDGKGFIQLEIVQNIS